jgi:hypothetical protein
VSSRTDEQKDRALSRSRGHATGVRALCVAAAVSTLAVAVAGPACAASPGSARLPKPVPRAVRAAAPSGVGARSLTAGTGAGGSTLGSTGGDIVQQGAVSVIDVIMVAPTASRPGGTVDLRTFADCEDGGNGTVTSAALAGPAQLTMAADGGLFAEATVARNADPGDYPLVETCAGKPVASGRLTVRRLGAPAAGGGWGATRLAGSGSGLGSALGLTGLRTAAGAPSRADEYASLALIAAASVGAVLFGYQRRRAVRG